jgi:hypothetical protein
VTYPARFYEIRYGDEKLLVTTSVVVVVNTQHGEGTKVQSVDVQRIHEFWDWDSLWRSRRASQRLYVEWGIVDLLPNVQLVIPSVSRGR